MGGAPMPKSTPASPASEVDGSLAQISRQIQILSEAVKKQGLGARPRAKLHARMDRLAKEIHQILHSLDPVLMPETVFDPSNPGLVGRVTGTALLAQERQPLTMVRPTYGSGVYAVYYSGDHPAYRPLSGTEHPIYVGKADPKNPVARSVQEQGTRLSGRLGDHKKNIAKAQSTLKLEDFSYRALVVTSGWQQPAERYLIDLFRPVWNSEIGVCFGFGKHGDDPNTRANLRSPWDTLHPGRGWAHRDPNQKDSKPSEQILAEIAAHFQDNRPYGTVDNLLWHFFEGLKVLA